MSHITVFKPLGFFSQNYFFLVDEAYQGNQSPIFSLFDKSIIKHFLQGL